MIDATFRAAARALTSPEMGTEAVAPLLYDLVMLHWPRRILEVGGGISSLYLLKRLAEFELMILIGSHKRRQNSVTLIRLTGPLHTQIHSVMP